MSLSRITTFSSSFSSHLGPGLEIAVSHGICFVHQTVSNVSVFCWVSLSAPSPLWGQVSAGAQPLLVFCIHSRDVLCLAKSWQPMRLSYCCCQQCFHSLVSQVMSTESSVVFVHTCLIPSPSLCIPWDQRPSHISFAGGTVKAYWQCNCWNL